jgi:hypothetical protein
MQGRVKSAGLAPRNLAKCESDTISSALGHPMHLPFTLIFLKSDSGIELCNDLFVPIVPESHQRLDPQSSTNINDIFENRIVCLLHISPIYPPSLCNNALLLSYDGSGMFTVYFGTPNMFITLWFGFVYGTNPPLGTLII